MAIKTKRIGSDRTRNELGKLQVVNTAFDIAVPANNIPAGSIVALTAVVDNRISAAKALNNGGTLELGLMVALNEIRETGTVVQWAIVDFDTGGAALGDPIFLSDAVAGTVTVTDPGAGSVIVGKVLFPGPLGTGKVFLRPHN